MMLRLALKTLRARKGGFIGAFLALFCAAALITACGGLLETGLRGKIATERYAAAPVIVSADQNVHQTTIKKKHGKTKVKHKAKPLAERVWLDAGLTDRLARVEGVRRVVPELTFPAQPMGKGKTDVPAYGHAWSSAALTPFKLTAGTAPRAAGDVVVDSRLGLKPGDRLTVQATSAPRTYRISGVAEGDVTRQHALFFSQAEAERLAARPGQATAIGLLGDDVSADAVRKALAGTKAQVSTGDDRGPVEFIDAVKARVKLISMGAAIGGTSLLVAILVVVGTFALTIQQRHRELALLRAVAASGKQIRRLIGREALLVGAVAGVLGALAGLPLSHWLLGRFTDLGAVPATLEPAIGFFPAAVALLATLLGAWSAARLAARRIARIRPAEALGEAALERRFSWGRTIAGLVLLAGGTTLVAVLSSLQTEAAATPVTFLAVIVLCGSVSLLGPLLVRAAAALLAGPLRLGRFPGVLARRNLRGNAVRMAAAVTPLALLIAMASTVLFSQPTLSSAAEREAADGTRADWVLASEGPGVPSAAAERVRKAPGVATVTEVVRTTVRVGLDKYPSQGVTSAGLARNWDPEVVSGSLKGFGRGDVAVSELAADQRDLKPGSKLKVTLGDGTPVTLRVAAVYARGLGFGDLTMAHSLVSRHVDNPLSAAVLVRTDGGRDGLAAAVRDFPGVRVLAPGEARDLAAERDQANADVNLLAMALILAFTAIAVVNTLAMSVSERVREFAKLRLAGATRPQVLRMLRLEALASLLTAAALGTGIAAAVLSAFSAGLTGTVSVAVAPLACAGVLGVAAVLALAATAAPGRVALAPKAVEVVGVE
ncbi:FtsX-like permease family protein [Streptomyces boninensis]|uniref:FtsX-like permease family protein n=1 Tax=Streptomyces boninensis TaxID=2039455 RepID=UPI003B2164CE